MTGILFVCHGNICRSPMAEFIFRKMCSENPVLRNMDVFIASAATSGEETGNDIYPYARAKLKEKGIPFERRRARRITPDDYRQFDLLIGMDDANIRNMCRFFNEERRTDDIEARYREGKKIFCLSEFYGSDRGIADPWYTDNFELAYSDIERGCRGLCEFLTKNRHCQSF